MRAILTYHSLDPSGSPISVDPGVFAAQVRWLASGAVRVVGLEELWRLPADADAVALTFDDAFENFGTVAAPLLREHGLPATLFVVTGHVGGQNDWNAERDPRIPTLPLLAWPALARLAEQGITLGGHTRRHPHLTRLAPEARAEELAGAADEMARETGRRPATFAYPYGDANAAVAAEARATFALGCTTELRAVAGGDDPLLLPRLDMYYLRAPGKLEAWGTARFAAELWVRAQGRRARSALAGARGGW